MADTRKVAEQGMQPETEPDIMTFLLTGSTQPPFDEGSDDSMMAADTNDPVLFISFTLIMCVTAMSEAGLPAIWIPSQTVTCALTTILTPSLSREGRNCVLRTSADFYTERGIFSDTSDRLYRPYQPDPKAYDNYYSPGACPHNMDFAAVPSRFNDTASVTYTDICCQRHVS